MLGYDPATFHVTKSKWVESLHPDDREAMVALTMLVGLEKSPTIKQSFAIVPRMVSGNGFFLSAKLLPESGEPIRALGVYTDIDDRKRAEAASILKNANRMAREIHDTLAQSIYRHSGSGAAKQVLMDDLEQLGHTWI